MSHFEISQLLNDDVGEGEDGQINGLVKDLNSICENQNLNVEIDGLLVCSGNVIHKRFAWGGKGLKH